MASRFATKPDPSIKKNVQRARASARTGKRGQVSVVAASIAATVFAWGLLSNQEVQALRAAQSANANQASNTIVLSAQSGADQASTPQVPLGLSNNLSDNDLSLSR